MCSPITSFKCGAENPVLYFKHTDNGVFSSLHFLDKPGKPTGPIVMKDITSDSLELEWKPPLDDGGLEITKYNIEKCETERMIWTKVSGGFFDDMNAFFKITLHECPFFFAPGWRIMRSHRIQCAKAARRCGIHVPNIGGEFGRRFRILRKRTCYR